MFYGSITLFTMHILKFTVQLVKFCSSQIQVEEILSAYHTNRADWKKFAKFDPYKYTRNLVHEGNGKFNLMLLCWAPGNQSSIHDHADAHCFVKDLDGTLKEVIHISLTIWC